MGAGHFIFIPCVLLVGIVIGWILGGRATRDAYAVELRKREASGEEERLVVPDSGVPGFQSCSRSPAD